MVELAKKKKKNRLAFFFEDLFDGFGVKCFYGALTLGILWLVGCAFYLAWHVIVVLFVLAFVAGIFGHCLAKWLS